MRLEAETLSLTDLETETKSFASGGSMIRIRSAREPRPPHRDRDVRRVAGSYDIVLGYFDEADGDATVEGADRRGCRSAPMSWTRAGSPTPPPAATSPRRPWRPASRSRPAPRSSCGWSSRAASWPASTSVDFPAQLRRRRAGAQRRARARSTNGGTVIEDAVPDRQRQRAWPTTATAATGRRRCRSPTPACAPAATAR